MAAQAAPDDSAVQAAVRQPAAPPTEDDLRASGWILWRGERQFGPMSGQELADYFRSRMAIATDAVTGPGWPERVPADEAARLLQVPAPLAASAPDAAKAASVATPLGGPIYVETVRGMSSIVIAVWLLVLLALQVQMSLRTISLPVLSTSQMLAHSLGKFALIALVCFGVLGALGKLIRGHFPAAVAPLFAMTVVYGVLFGRFFLAHDPLPASIPLSASAAIASNTNNASGPEFPAARPVDTTQDDQQVKVSDSVGYKDWFGFAKALENKKDWQGLVTLTLEWATKEPQNPAVWTFQGIGYEGLKQPSDALLAYQQASVLAPDKVYVWNNLANVQLVLKRLAESEATSRRALEIDSNSPKAWNNLGAALQGEQRNDEALDAYQHALRIDPNFSTAWGNLGFQYYYRKQWPEALNAYQKAVALDPTDQYAITGIANVQQMQRLQ